MPQEWAYPQSLDHGILKTRYRSQITAITDFELTHNLLLGCKKGKLIFANITQATNLDTMDFISYVWCDIGGKRRSPEEIWEFRICVLAMLMMNEGLKRRISIRSVSKMPRINCRTYFVSASHTGR